MQLRGYQSDAISALYRFFETDVSNLGNPLVVIPTGGGKSLVIADFIKGAMSAWPDTRIIVLTHVKELIVQNFQEMIRLWPDAPIGIYSAGVGRKDLGRPLLYAGIQSVHKKAFDLGRVDLVLIDEAHLMPRSAQTMYRRFLEELERVNPHLRVIGFTATPFRLDSGYLTEGESRVFTDVAFEVTIKELINEGYLAPLVAKPIETVFDISGVGKRGGEFIAGQLEQAVDTDDNNIAAVREIVQYGADRQSWLIFCAGVDHSQHVRDIIRSHGITCEMVTGDTPAADRDRTVARFKRGEIRALTNVNVLTTGFNVPQVDLLAFMRPTESAGMYVQMAGRGTRNAPGKADCLVLDFAGNIARHGPVDAVKPKRPGEGGGDAPWKECPQCGADNFAGVRHCVRCGFEFPEPEVEIARTASALDPLSKDEPDWFQVSDVFYDKYQRFNKRPTLRASYIIGLNSFQEWIAFEGQGVARRKAEDWWLRRAPGTEIPGNVDDALAWSDLLAKPTEIAVRKEGKYTNIVGARFP